MTTIKNILLYLWQLLQNLLGLAVRAYFKRRSESYGELHLNDAILSVASGMRGGVSLGKYIILGEYDDRVINNSTITYLVVSEYGMNLINHEYGHCRQSKYLGPAYLFTVGICSILWTQVYKKVGKSYYWLWCEKWADRLGGVKREK